MMMKTHNRLDWGSGSLVARVSALVVLGLLAVNMRVANVLCETKEFDWNELGLSIPSSRISSLASYGGNNASSNLRILVSPQRRMTPKK